MDLTKSKLNVLILENLMMNCRLDRRLRCFQGEVSHEVDAFGGNVDGSQELKNSWINQTVFTLGLNRYLWIFRSESQSFTVEVKL